MSSNGPTNKDRELLARLNALRKSTVDLDTKQYSSVPSSSTASQFVPLDPSPARALHADLTSRFAFIKRPTSSQLDDSSKEHISESLKIGTPLHDPELQNETNDKTVEDLLTELGPATHWDIGQDEEREIQTLLANASHALNHGPELEVDEAAQLNHNNPPIWEDDTRLPAVDVSAFQPGEEAEGDSDEEHVSKDKVKYSIDQEADVYLQQIMDEIAHEPGGHAGLAQPDETNKDHLPPYTEPSPNPGQHQRPSSPSSAAAAQPSNEVLDLPSTPSKNPDPGQHPNPTSNSVATGAAGLSDTSLASRLASLKLPSNMSSALVLPSAPKSPTVDDDSWCCICLSDATLYCAGCAEDDPDDTASTLYCNRCWMEGHRGESTGFEERQHRAVVLSDWKKKGKRKERRRVAMGA